MMLSPPAITAPARLMQKYMLQSMALDTTLRTFQPTALHTTIEFLQFLCRPGYISPISESADSEPLPYSTEFIFVPIATVDTPKANPISFLPRSLISSTPNLLWSYLPNTKIPDITRVPSPQTRQATKLLTSLADQCTYSIDFTAAAPILFSPRRETKATETPTTMHSSSPHRQLSAMSALSNFSIAPKMMKKKMSPATSDTEKLYFMKMSAVCMMREERLSNISFCWLGCSSIYCRLGFTSSTRLAIAHSNGTSDSTTENITIPYCVRGAKPSGVEEPTIGYY